MKNILIKTIITLWFLFLKNSLTAQPGPFGSDLVFSIRDNNPNYKVLWYSEREKTHTALQSVDGKYTVPALKTPIGGGAFGHIEIIRNKDTMFVYHPRINQSSPTVLVNIPFRKGEFAVPSIVYQTQLMFKQSFRKQLKPNLEGDWEEFEIGKTSPTGTVTLRRIEMFKSSDLFNLLMPNNRGGTFFSDNAYHLKNKFQDETTYEAIIGNGFYSPRHFKYYFFGIKRGTNQYFLQREENSVLEYGTIDVPIDRSVQKQQPECPSGLLYPNLKDDIYFSLYSYLQGNEPTVMGYYHGIKKCDEDFGSVKPMWGIFKIIIDKPDEETMKLIIQENNFDNNLN